MFFSSNLKKLRLHKKRSQQDLADFLGLSRSLIAGYEGQHSQPTAGNLLIISDFFQISIDTLLKIDLSTLSPSQLQDLLRGNDIYVKGSKLRVLSTTVDRSDKENIEVVPVKAKAGYLNGFHDPEFIASLSRFQFPVLNANRTYRMFQIEGDSMLPVPDKSYVIGEYLENWQDIKDGQLCILVTREDGIIFKKAFNHLKKSKSLFLESLNPLYPPFEVKAMDIQEVWKFSGYYSNQLPEIKEPETIRVLREMQQELQRLHQKIVS